MRVKMTGNKNYRIMKKTTKLLQINMLALALAGFAATDAAGQIDNLANLSPEYVRTGARNAATDAPDAAVYNPAGLTNLDDGIHIAIGNQSLFRNPTHEYDLGLGEGTKKYSQNDADWLLPNIYATWKKKSIAVYGGYYIAGGGATADYPTGSITTDLIGMMALMQAQGAYQSTKEQYLEASSAYSTFFTGIAITPITKLSVAVSARFITAKNTTKAGVTMFSSPLELPDAPLALNSEETATGVGFVLSANYTLSKNITVSSRYETNVELDFKTNTLTDDLGVTVDGSKSRRDLPAVLAFGTQIKLSEKVTVMADYNYYFQKGADWGTMNITGEEMEWSKLAGDASLYGLSFEYKITNKLSASLGTVYTAFDYPEKDLYFTKPGAFETVIDDNISINTGIKYAITDRFAVNAGLMQNIWAKDVKVKALNAYPLDVDVTTNNSMTTVALGINMNF
jgi:long-chain fatty acid transport protein